MAGYRSFCSHLLFAVITVCVMCAGCSREYHKADADKEVYEIIDAKWKQGYGEKSNYHISDTVPSPNDIQIEQKQPMPEVLRLAEAVAIATAENRNYQTQKEDLYLQALSLTGERHKYARQWFSLVDTKFTKEGSDEDISIETKSGFERTQLLSDGILLGTGLVIDWVRFLTGDSRTTLGSLLTASLEIPLMGAVAGKVDRENLTQAERNVIYEIRSFNRFRKTFVVSIVNDYYRVLQRRDSVTNAENDYERRVESKERLEALADAGRKPRFEVDQAEQDVLRARDNFVQAQQSYKQQLDEFKIRLALPTDAKVELDQNELKALEAIGITELNYTVGDAIETALVSRLDLANSADFVDDTARRVMLAADGLGPQINLVGRAGVGSQEKTDFYNFQFDDGLYEFGIEADLPLDRKIQRNAYRAALISLERIQRQYDRDVDLVKFGVRESYRRLQEAAERYQIQKISLELASRRVESTELLLEAGRAKTRDLLESQDALLAAENALTAALVDHTIAKLNFFRDVGILQVKPDGMWKLGREVARGRTEGEGAENEEQAY